MENKKETMRKIKELNGQRFQKSSILALCIK